MFGSRPGFPEDGSYSCSSEGRRDCSGGEGRVDNESTDEGKHSMEFVFVTAFTSRAMVQIVSIPFGFFFISISI